jgi:hypothetical protein
MRTGIPALVSAMALTLVLANPQSVKAGDAGRYQLIMQEDLILVLDTQEGHLWQWQSFVQANADIVYDTTYLGKMRPGKQAGEVIDSWTWTIGDWRRRRGMSAPPE